jgi:hypothetical protein
MENEKLRPHVRAKLGLLKRDLQLGLHHQV